MTLDALSPSLVFVLMGVFALLLLATSSLGAAMAATHVFGGPGRAIASPILPELRARLRSWWIMAASFSACLILGRDMSLVFLALVSFLVLREYLSVTPFGARDRVGLFVAYATIPLQYGWIARGHAGAAAIVPIAALAMLGSVAALRGSAQDFLRSSALVIWGIASKVGYVVAASSAVAGMMRTRTSYQPAWPVIGSELERRRSLPATGNSSEIR